MRNFSAITATLLLLVASAHNLPLEASDEDVPRIPYEYGQYDVLPEPEVRNGLANQNKRWPNATIPYVFGDGFDENNKTFIMQMFDIYHNHTCIKFVPWTGETDYLYIDSTGDGCYADVGHMGGRQTVNFNVAQYCIQQGVILHELMHTIGFQHEQVRVDRDQYVRIEWENVSPDALYWFNIMPGETNDFGVGYDYESLMHYTRDAFSKNGKPTIVPLYDHEGLKLGEKDFFSEKDIIKIRRMYQCDVEESNEKDVDVVANLSDNIRGAYEQFKKDGNFKKIFVRTNELFMSFLTGLLK